MQELQAFSTITEMETWLRKQGQDFIRQYLLREFETVRSYKTTSDWNNAVVICEALAIIGWGDTEFVNAICTKRENRWETQLLSTREKNAFVKRIG